MQMAEVGKGMCHGVCGSQIFLEGNAAHHGRQQHPLSCLEVVRFLDGVQVMLCHHANALQGDPVAQRMQHGGK